MAVWNEIDRALLQYWLSRSEEERIRAVCGMYNGEKAILENLAPKYYSDADKREFVYYHMHGEKWPTEKGEL